MSGLEYERASAAGPITAWKRGITLASTSIVHEKRFAGQEWKRVWIRDAEGMTQTRAAEMSMMRIARLVKWNRKGRKDSSQP